VVRICRIATIGLGLFGEELLYRGFLQTHLESVVGAARGWIPASLLFGLMHIAVVFVHGPAAGLNAVVQAAVFGALWGDAFAKNRTLLVLWPAMFSTTLCQEVSSSSNAFSPSPPLFNYRQDVLSRILKPGYVRAHILLPAA
jgi:Type II CAAX prenyl endopeptidase Rce1-like